MACRGHSLAFKHVDDSTDQEYSSCANTNEDIYSWIRQHYRESRGAELPGTVNPTVLESLFRQQAVPWRQLSTDHLNTIHSIIADYNARSWLELVADETVRQRLEDHNIGSMRKARDQATTQLSLLLADELSGILQTTNHYFADNVAGYRQDRVLHRLKKLGLHDDSTQYAPTLTLAQVTKAAHLSNEDQAIYDIHDTLKSYYKVAFKRFVDNVVVQVVERCYVGSEGPVKNISPQYIGELTDDELSDIAQESYATSSTRVETSFRLERLEKALAIAEVEQRR